MGTPVAFCLGVSSLTSVVYLGLPQVVVFQRLNSGVSGIALRAVAFFIYSGNLMVRGDIARRLVALAGSFVGHLRGALTRDLSAGPARRSCPVKLIRLADARRVELGSWKIANQRVNIQFLHPEVSEPCQVLMGYTQFQPGSLWNTVPPHLHDRRMEAYLYFEVPPDARVFHFMGKPEETQPMALANEGAAAGINVNAIAPGYGETNNTQRLRDNSDRNKAVLGRIPRRGLGQGRGHRPNGGVSGIPCRRLNPWCGSEYRWGIAGAMTGQMA